jgi:hypothetical protein
VLRALQLANFTTQLLLDDDAQLAHVLRRCPGSTPRLSRGSTTRASARPTSATAPRRGRAAGSPAELQGKTADTDGVVRFTAPSVVFEHGRRVVAGGFQPIEAYDVLVANPTLAEAGVAADTPLPLLELYADGMTTQEVALAMTHGNDFPDLGRGRDALPGWWRWRRDPDAARDAPSGGCLP